jgi:hypothetical protein
LLKKLFIATSAPEGVVEKVVLMAREEAAEKLLSAGQTSNPSG